MSDFPQSRKQSLASLQRANLIRLERSKDKARIGTAPAWVDAAELVVAILRVPPTQWQKATAYELLTSVDRVGRHRALGLLRAAGVQEGRFLSELTERQRFALAAVFCERAEGRIAA